MLKKIVRASFFLVGLFLLYVIITLAHGTYTDWSPPSHNPLAAIAQSKATTIEDSVISLTIWNVGYGGLGAESDFFYDDGGFFLAGGRDIRPAQPLVAKNIAGAKLTVQTTQSDFFLLQEVDSFSRRSYYAKFIDSLRNSQPDYAAYYAPNYQVTRMPLPLLEPWRAYGKVNSGLLSLSAWQPQSVERISLPGAFPWPTRIFQLDRCLLVQRFATSWGKTLVVVNGHLSAYDKTGALKRQQMEFIKAWVLKEYEKGHYVIVGADWNQCPPNFPFDSFSPGQTDGYTQSNISSDFLPSGWQWLYDPTIPTNRKVRAPYQAGRSFTTIIDFYLLSPNLQAKQVKTLQQEFAYSDHQPVWLEVMLK